MIVEIMSKICWCPISRKSKSLKFTRHACARGNKQCASLERVSTFELNGAQYLYGYTECLPFTKKSRNFGWTVNGKAILVFPTENFQNKRNVLRGSPKFPTGISKGKIVFH